MCYKAGVKVVTVYAFSIENFKRSKYEVDALMEMAKVKLSQLAQHGDLLDRYGASIRVLGRRELVKPDVLEAIDRAVDITSRNGDAVLNICFPYTSRDEIASAIRNTVIEYSTPLDRSQLPGPGTRRTFSESHIERSIKEHAPSGERPELRGSDDASPSRGSDNSSETDGTGDRSYDSHSSLSSATTSHQPPSASGTTKLATVPELYSSYPPNSDQLIFHSPETINVQTLNDHMLTGDCPPLDLLVRTSGVQRLSDFMLWQCHQNTQIVFLDTLWPSFGLFQFLPVLWEWQRRIRKQGRKLDCEYDLDEGYSSGSLTPAEGDDNAGRRLKTL